VAAVAAGACKPAVPAGAAAVPEAAGPAAGERMTTAPLQPTQARRHEPKISPGTPSTTRIAAHRHSGADVRHYANAVDGGSLHLVTE